MPAPRNTSEVVELGRQHGSAGQVVSSRCRAAGRCRFRTIAPDHHDQLLHVADDLGKAMDLLDLALTWGELDYSDEQVIGPGLWDEFLRAHRWPDVRLASRLFDLAADIALRSSRSAAFLFQGAATMASGA